jgi:hypothetical protein
LTDWKGEFMPTKIAAGVDPIRPSGGITCG